MTNLVKHFENRLVHTDPFELMFKNFFDTDSFFTPVVETNPKYPVDISETDKGVKFEIATPGLTQDDIEITVKEGNVLTVSYEKQKTEEVKEQNYIQQGIAKRSFNFGWRIGSKFDISQIDANMRNGLLTIEIPNSPETQPKKIAIKSSKK